MSRSRFFSSRKNEGLKGTDDRNSCKSNPRVVVCTHLYALSIGNSVGCNEGLLRQKNVKWHPVIQRYQHLGCQCHPNGSKYCIQFTSSNNGIFSGSQIINQHPWLSENYNEEWPIPANPPSLIPSFSTGGLPIFMLKSAITQELFHDIIKQCIHTTALGLHKIYYCEYLGIISTVLDDMWTTVTLASPRYGQGLLCLTDISSATRLPPQPPA